MNAPSQLKREVGVWGAVFLGLGSILGSGVFVSISLAADAAGPAVLLAVIVAACVAACNGLSSAQLAANHAVSGGTYEYGHVFLTPRIGFIAGWLFLAAKSASAATAALGFAGYTMSLIGIDGDVWRFSLAIGAIALLTLLVLAGAKRTSWVNATIVVCTLVALIGLVFACLPTVFTRGKESFAPFMKGDGVFDTTRYFLQACALMFVAYTGYGRIATMGEEITEPKRNIPRAIIATLVVSLLIYAGVAIVSVGTVGASEFAAVGIATAAPLEFVGERSAVPFVSRFVAVGAITAMVGVLLNLILGLSRVIMAMGRRGDLPDLFAKVDSAGKAPVAAVILTSVIVAGLACLGSVKATWSFSAFTVLTYYAITNLAALQLSNDQRLFPRVFMWLGLAACLSLSVWVEPVYWMAGLGTIAVGMVWREAYRFFSSR